MWTEDGGWLYRTKWKWMWTVVEMNELKWMWTVLEMNVNCVRNECEIR